MINETSVVDINKNHLCTLFTTARTNPYDIPIVSFSISVPKTLITMLNMEMF